MLAIAVAAFTFTACSDVPAPYDLPSINNGPDPTTGILSANFKKGQGDWKTQDVNLPSQLTAIWSYNSKYGMVATAYSDNVNYESESWLIGPAADLSSVEKAVLTIKHAANYFSTSVPVNKACGVMVSTDYSEGASPATATWDELTLSQWPTSFTYIEATADMSKYAGKPKVYVALKYTSTSSKAGTWEVEALSIAEGEANNNENPSTETIGTKENPITVAQALEKINALPDKGKSESKAYVKGKVVKVTTNQANFEKYGNLNYLISDDGNETNTITVYSGDGLDGAKFTSITDLAAGDEVIVFGNLYKYVNKSNQVTPEIDSGNYLVSLVKGSGGGGGETPSGEATGSGTQADPFNVAAAIAKCQETGQTATSEVYYVKGIVNAEYTVDSYKNATFELVDAEGASEKFTAYRVKGADGADLKIGYKVPKGATVIVSGKLVNYKGNTPETAQNSGTLISVNGQAPELDGEGGGGGNEPGGGGETATSLVNGDFETWANGLPTGWQSASTASSATLEQSTDAHGGSYAVLVKGDEGSNKRLASQEITLAAGSYNFSFWVKPTTTDVSQVRPAYVVVVDNKVNGSYQYGDYATLSSGWQQISYDFTLSAETTVCLVVMNPKKSSYSSGKDVIIDDATLTKK
jgi:hypothetical protein